MGACSEDNCERATYGRGLCKMHYQRARTRGTLGEHSRTMVPAGAGLDERLRHHGWTVTAAGCWEWAASLGTHGYGQLAVGGSGPMAASRAAYIAWVGPAGRGDFVCHRCDNRKCINPEHLFLGKDVDNIADMTAKGRHAHGERRKNHKPTGAQVSEIRSRYSAGGVRQKTLANEFGVSRTLVSLITSEKRRTRPTRYSI